MNGVTILSVAHTVRFDEIEIIRIISARSAAYREKNIMSMVRYKQSELPPLTKEQKAQLNTLSEMSDSEIDFSDIPPLDDAFFKNAVKNPFYRPTKKSTTVRVDSDVLTWLKSQGKGYQTQLNSILREAMLRAQHK